MKWFINGFRLYQHVVFSIMWRSYGAVIYNYELQTWMHILQRQYLYTDETQHRTNKIVDLYDDEVHLISIPYKIAFILLLESYKATVRVLITLKKCMFVWKISLPWSWLRINLPNMRKHQRNQKLWCCSTFSLLVDGFHMPNEKCEFPKTLRGYGRNALPFNAVNWSDLLGTHISIIVIRFDSFGH